MDFFRQLKGPLATMPRLHTASAWSFAARMNWDVFCSASQADRDQSRVRVCRAPDNTILGLTPADREDRDVVLSCNTMGYLLENQCTKAPTFPDDSMVFQTWHSDYVRYSAYFDLGHALAYQAIKDIESNKYECDLTSVACN